MTASDDRWGLPRDVNSTVDMADDVQRCIYHLEADGGFEKEAHLIPESSSNERCVLPPGRECDRCNGDFSRLEQEVIRSFPGQLFRVAFVDQTSRGRTPTANIKGGKITRTEVSADSAADSAIQIRGYSANPDTVEVVHEPDRSIITFKPRPPSGGKMSAFLARVALGYLCLEGRDVYSSEYDHLRSCCLAKDPDDPSTFIPCFIGVHMAETQSLGWLRNGTPELDKLRVVSVQFPGFSGLIPTARGVIEDDRQRIEDVVKELSPGFLAVRKPGPMKPITFKLTMLPMTDENKRQQRELWEATQARKISERGTERASGQD